jgi:hypothetical protein
LDVDDRLYSTTTSTESAADALCTTTQVRPRANPCTLARPFTEVTLASDVDRETKLSPAELSRAPEPTRDARKLEPVPREMVSRSNEVMILPSGVAGSAGGAAGSAEHPASESDNTAKTPIRVGDGERIGASGQ